MHFNIAPLEPRGHFLLVPAADAVSLSLSLSLSLYLSIYLFRSPSLPPSLSLSVPFSLSLSLSSSSSIARSHTLSRSLAYSLARSLALSLSSLRARAQSWKADTVAVVRKSVSVSFHGPARSPERPFRTWSRSQGHAGPPRAKSWTADTRSQGSKWPCVCVGKIILHLLFWCCNILGPGDSYIPLWLWHNVMFTIV